MLTTDQKIAIVMAWLGAPSEYPADPRIQEPNDDWWDDANKAVAALVAACAESLKKEG